MTTLLELVGLALIIAAAYLFAGPALALLTAGGACLLVAYRIERERARRRKAAQQ